MLVAEAAEQKLRRTRIGGQDGGFGAYHPRSEPAYGNRACDAEALTRSLTQQFTEGGPLNLGTFGEELDQSSMWI